MVKEEPIKGQVAHFCLGWRPHGARGGIAASVLCVLSSAFILLGLSWLCMAGGDILWVSGIFYGLVPAVIAIVVLAVKRIGSKALRERQQQSILRSCNLMHNMVDMPQISKNLSVRKTETLRARKSNPLKL